MTASSAIWEYDFRAYEDQDPGLTFIRRSEALGRAQRCITANQRNYAHTLKQLQTLQAKRIHDPAPAVTAAANEPLKSQLVSFSPKDYPSPPECAEPNQSTPKTPPITPWPNENLPIAA